MDFEIDQAIRAPIEQVAESLLDADFIAATSALPRLDDCVLLSRKVDTDGTVRLQIHRRFGAHLNAAISRVVDPAKLTWVEHVAYTADLRDAHHVIDADHYSDRIRCSYTTILESYGASTTRRTRGAMTVRAPLVARKVELAIVDGLKEYAAAEAELLSAWVS